MNTATAKPIAKLEIAQELQDLVANELTPGTGISADRFWEELAQIVAELGPRNAELLKRRDEFQAAIDNWYITVKKAGASVREPTVRLSFQRSIGYLVPGPGDFQISTENVDREIASVAGPQLVVPLDNARYALNAANARWGSLFDALYGTDVIADEKGAERGSSYNPIRGARVVERTTHLLDVMVPLANASHGIVTGYELVQEEGRLALAARLEDKKLDRLRNAARFIGYTGSAKAPTSILLRKNGLHIELQIDREHPIGRGHNAGLKDVMVESAVTSIQDCEDSVSAVDAADKVKVYRNWLGLMKGTLTASFEKGGKSVERTLQPDRHYMAANGKPMTLPGRSLMLVRNVGLHMYTDAVTSDGEEIPEGFLDTMMTALAGKHDLQAKGEIRNSRTGSIYIVKPKMHGPEEVAATVELFARVEKALGLPDKTIKLGLMDEERRMTINLQASIYEARDRIVFINTGFLDRTGDEIHTMMEAGPVRLKGENKTSAWLNAYETRNVDVALACGFAGRAQIGKGMWAMPDAMDEMLKTKNGHLLAGASTSWVPSPTAATLHALHYHQIDVAQLHKSLMHRKAADLVDILAIPLIIGFMPDAATIQRELDNNAQSILGYVVRWIQQGIGCSKVPDINNVALMEDRATLRISSQHIANWLHHDLVTPQQVRESFSKMAAIVDTQNANDPDYTAMGPGLDDCIAFQAALALVFEGREQPNGYTEHLLHHWRRKYKAS